MPAENMLSAQDFSGPVETMDWMAYEYLRLRARALLQRETWNRGWEPAELVHEAFVRIARSRIPIRFQDRTHFYAVAQLTMRRILIDSARSARASRAIWFEPLDADSIAVSGGNRDSFFVRDALDQLARREARMFAIVQLRFYWGFELDEIGEALSLSTRTVRRQLFAARRWLHDRLSQTAGSSEAGPSVRNGRLC